MPKRVLDFDAMWASDKLASCAEWAQAEYAWFYGLADASGSFELTNLRVIWGRVAAIRTSLTLERVTQIFEEFIARGLLFTWEENGKRYGHWTGSDVPGRLPPPSWRARLERLAPPVPREALAAYMARFGSRRAASPATPAVTNANASVRDGWAAGEYAPGRDERQLRESLKPCLEEAQAQDLDLNLGLEGNWKGREAQPHALGPNHSFLDREERAAGEARAHSSFCRSAANTPAAPAREGGAFRAQPSPPRRSAGPGVYAGAGPQAAAFGARVKPAALERIRAREMARAPAGAAARGDARTSVSGELDRKQIGEARKEAAL